MTGGKRAPRNKFRPWDVFDFLFADIRYIVFDRKIGACALCAPRTGGTGGLWPESKLPFDRGTGLKPGHRENPQVPPDHHWNP